jgi:hypothetical protein
MYLIGVLVSYWGMRSGPSSGGPNGFPPRSRAYFAAAAQRNRATDFP